MKKNDTSNVHNFLVTDSKDFEEDEIWNNKFKSTQRIKRQCD